MAAVATARPGIPQPKLKRPPSVLSGPPSPPLALQKASTPSTSAATSMSHGVNGLANGVASRSSVRRREPHKPGDVSARSTRNPKPGMADAVQGEKRKRMYEPFVKTSSYILKKFRGKPPSLIIHLHPTHFKFEQQDGSFSYNSHMKVLLEHIRYQTVPHDMLDELTQAGIKFYENCLIVQIYDHRSASSSSQSSSGSSKLEKNVPFSVHNHNAHITPSPYVPHPELHKAEATAKDASAKDAVSNTTHDGTIVKTEKENQPPAELRSLPPNSAAKSVKTFTTVLFPTPLSQAAEILSYATTPDLRSTNRKQSQADNRVPGSAGLTQPPTPLSTVPPTPSSLGPPAKRQKMRISGADVANFESALLVATCAPLFLEPAENLQDCEKIAKALQDPLAMHKPPAPKARKKTSAELAADDALAAESQRFMLLMDEQPEHTADTASGSGPNDGHTGATTFAPRFERFKAIEEIQLAHKEKARRNQEAKELRDQQIALDKLKQEQAQRESAARQQMQMGQAHASKQRHEHLQQIQLRQQQVQAAQHAQHAQQQASMNTLALQQQGGQHPAGAQSIGPTPNGVLNNVHHVKVSQAMQSSPIMRNGTPQNHASSPLIGDPGLGQAAMSVPMGISTSSQGAGSPSRPGSAMQHGHPNPAAMAAHRNGVQPPSRNGTPRMPNGTPGLRQATPVQRHTPTPRMSHASPAASAMAGTPVLGQTMMATPQMNGQPLTQQQQLYLQQQHLLRENQYRQQQMRAAAQQQHMERQMLGTPQGLQGSPPNPQMSPRNQQMLQQMQLQNHAQGNTNQELYMRQLQNMRNTQDLSQAQLHAAQQAANRAQQNPAFQFNAQGQRIMATPNPNNATLAHAQQVQAHAAAQAAANGQPPGGQPGSQSQQAAAQRSNQLANMFLQKRMADLWPREMENLQRRYNGARPPESAVQQTKQLLHQRVKQYVQQNGRALIAAHCNAQAARAAGAGGNMNVNVGGMTPQQQRQMVALQQGMGGAGMGNGAVGMMQGIQTGMVGGGIGVGGQMQLTREQQQQQQQQYALQQQAQHQAAAQQHMMQYQMGGL